MSNTLLMQLHDAAREARRLSERDCAILLTIEPSGFCVRGRRSGIMEFENTVHFSEADAANCNVVLRAVRLVAAALKRISTPESAGADTMGFIDRADVPVDRMRRSIHRSHRGEGKNFVD